MRSFLLASLFLAIALCSTQLTLGQEKLRWVEKPAKFTYPNMPVQVSVKLDSKPMSNMEARTGQDWLYRISLEIANASAKDIKFLSINLILREGSPEVPTIAIPMGLENSEPKKSVIKPGDRVVLRTAGSAVDFWLNHLKEKGHSDDVEKVILSIRQVGFTDGTGWYMGLETQTSPESGIQPSVLQTTDPSVFFCLMTSIGQMPIM